MCVKDLLGSVDLFRAFLNVEYKDRFRFNFVESRKIEVFYG